MMHIEKASASRISQVFLQARLGFPIPAWASKSRLQANFEPKPEPAQICLHKTAKTPPTEWRGYIMLEVQSDSVFRPYLACLSDGRSALVVNIIYQYLVPT